MSPVRQTTAPVAIRTTTVISPAPRRPMEGRRRWRGRCLRDRGRGGASRSRLTGPPIGIGAQSCSAESYGPPPTKGRRSEPGPFGGPPDRGKNRGMRIELVLGDITDQRVDAIVNAANSSLMGGGGVDGAIHRKGGPQILAECKQIRRDRYPDGLPTGQAVATSAGRLPATWVIHTVGPVFSESEDRSHLL